MIESSNWFPSCSDFFKQTAAFLQRFSLLLLGTTRVLTTEEVFAADPHTQYIVRKEAFRLRIIAIFGISFGRRFDYSKVEDSNTFESFCTLFIIVGFLVLRNPIYFRYFGIVIDELSLRKILTKR
jgi:hypothetical protein